MIFFLSVGEEGYADQAEISGISYELAGIDRIVHFWVAALIVLQFYLIND